MASQPVAIRINGKDYAAEVEPRLLLVDFIRRVAGLTGTHIGCDTSNCGACTIHLDGRTVKSCTMFAVQADGHELTTIEGVARGGTLHPVQQAFHEHHGLQCGYCTPGMIMSTLQLLARNSAPTREEIRRGIAGNICRCTGYQGIVDSIEAAARMLQAAPKEG
ncbi:MAG: (2Fe-2S)-binding protein [Chloroflexi bacterium]|nr:(2Fe-2S)-binding protein [Chloroflexota bacterium]